jgi:hypothetical protein
MAKTKKQVEVSQASEQIDEAVTEAELPIIFDPAPIPSPPPIAGNEPLIPSTPPEPLNPFAYSDIQDIVRVPNGFECKVKFDCRDDYLLFLATADDVEAHGRAIYAECASGQWGDTPHYFPTDAELLGAVQERASRELHRANSEVTKYQDRVDVDDATDADIALLMAWKKYRVALNRIPDQAGYPHAITWPVTPDTPAI